MKLLIDSKQYSTVFTSRKVKYKSDELISSTKGEIVLRGV
jgi:hypothetical protein